jgi:hypothetical protein
MKYMSFNLKVLAATALLNMGAYGASDEPTKKTSKDKLGAGYHVVDSTVINFTDQMIDGKMRSPTGFLLEGRKKTKKLNMIRLRTNFAPQLIDSKAAVQSIGAPLP